MKTSLKRTIIIASVAVCAIAAAAATAALALNRRDAVALPETERITEKLLCIAEPDSEDSKPGSVSEPATEPEPETDPETEPPAPPAADPEPEQEQKTEETDKWSNIDWSNIDTVINPPPLFGQSSARDYTQSRQSKARAVAEELAAAIPDGTDWERVSIAAAVVAEYCSCGVYTMDGEYYDTAYGVFIKGEYSCAGATRALGMLLECMGYSWTHVNENLYTHQWVEVYMDGQLGWADGQLGIADYGEFPYAERVG